MRRLVEQHAHRPIDAVLDVRLDEIPREVTGGPLDRRPDPELQVLIAVLEYVDADGWNRASVLLGAVLTWLPGSLAALQFRPWAMAGRPCH